MSASTQDVDPNTRLACMINREARSDPNSPYAGKYVGIARGKVVAIADDLKTLLHALDQIEPDPAKAIFLEASGDYEGPHEIWST